jgi:hypothetical protein
MPAVAQKISEGEVEQRLPILHRFASGSARSNPNK